VKTLGTATPSDLPGRLDDLLTTGQTPEVSRVVMPESHLHEHLHQLPEHLLRSRVRAWVGVIESPDQDFWIGTYTADGKWIWCASRNDRWLPVEYRVAFAHKVCRHVNKAINNGGAWLCGFIRGGRQFYMLWKDADGDIQIPIEFDHPFMVMSKWPMDSFEKKCAVALGIWSEHRRGLELGKDQTVNRAAGQKTTKEHLAVAPQVGL
jgi:hypothetical protein